MDELFNESFREVLVVRVFASAGRTVNRLDSVNLSLPSFRTDSLKSSGTSLVRNDER